MTDITTHPEYDPVYCVYDLNSLNNDEIFQGYLSVTSDKRTHNVPGSDKSKSFWHGWRNGMIDKGFADKDYYATILAEEVFKTGYLKLRN